MHDVTDSLHNKQLVFLVYFKKRLSKSCQVIGLKMNLLKSAYRYHFVSIITVYIIFF